jgi:hypothetical protein
MIQSRSPPFQHPHAPARVGGRRGRADRLGLSALVYL